MTLKRARVSPRRSSGKRSKAKRKSAKQQTESPKAVARKPCARTPGELKRRRLTTAELLALEKHRRALPPDSLVFISMHDIAQYCWCPMYAVRKSQKCEVDVFEAYLQDRITYARRLSLLTASPQTSDQILKIGDDITLAQVESFFAFTTGKPIQRRRTEGVSRPPEREAVESKYSAGKRAQAEFAEVYPTFRWNFKWKEFTVIGLPDGLPPNAVYEFKSTKQRRWLKTSMEVASTQADLYGFFFDRPLKRVQVRVIADEQTETVEAPVDRDNAISTLEGIRSIVRGELPKPPETFKCRSCDLAGGCPIRRN